MSRKTESKPINKQSTWPVLAYRIIRYTKELGVAWPVPEGIPRVLRSREKEKGGWGGCLMAAWESEWLRSVVSNWALMYGRKKKKKSVAVSSSFMTGSEVWWGIMGWPPAASAY